MLYFLCIRPKFVSTAKPKKEGGFVKGSRIFFAFLIFKGHFWTFSQKKFKTTLPIYKVSHIKVWLAFFDPVMAVKLNKSPNKNGINHFFAILCISHILVIGNKSMCRKKNNFSCFNWWICRDGQNLLFMPRIGLKVKELF